MPRLSRPVAALVLAAAFSAPATVRAAGEPQRVTAVEGITEYRLQNGLRVLLFPDPTKQTITVNITYLVGARHEGYGETGMAHLLEHMVFKGTDKHPNIPQELTAHGARPNGATSFDRTNYFETFQATDENLKWALELEADRMVNSHVWKKDLDTEMTVVRNEFEAGENSPQNVLIKRVMAAAYEEQNYHHQTIGARSDIENAPIERLQAFYRRYYQPDNAVLTVTGKFEEAKVLALVASTFGPIPKPERVLIPTYTVEPVQDGERQVTLRRVGDEQLVVAAYHVPSGLHEDAVPLQMLAYVLGNTPAGRLHKALVEKEKASSVFGFGFNPREPGLLFFGAEVRQEKPLEDAKKTLLETIDALAATPVTKEELERARTKALKDFELALNQSEVVGLQISEWIAKGDWRLFFLNRDRIRKVTPEDVQRVALKYLKASNRTLGEFLPTPKPDRAEVPQAPEASALLQGYTGDKAIAAGEVFDPSPANVEARTRRSTLPGGLKLALLPKKTRGGTVVASLSLHFGTEAGLRGKRVVSDLAGDMLTRGTAVHTRQQFADELDKLKARLTISANLDTLHARIETVRESLPGTLKLLAEALRQPTFPADQFEQLRQENLAAFEQEKSEPQAMAHRAFTRRLAPYAKDDARYEPTLDELIAEYKGATVAQAKEFHAGFLGASHGEFAVVGDFDAKETSDLVRALLDGWAAQKPYARIEHPFHDVSAGNEKLEAPDKANAILLAGENLALRDSDPDYPALVLGNYMLGGGFLNSRLAVRIRQKEGLSYGVGSQLSARALDASGSFAVFAIHAPQNTWKLENALREEIARALEGGFTEQEVSEAKSGWLQSRQVSRANDHALAGTLASELHLGRTLQWDADFEKKVNELKPVEIRDALRRRLDPKKLTVVRAGDFAKAPAAP
jgi:zinc protease